MSVLKRRMFNQGGVVTSRGTGITSGLTPVQRFDNGGEVDGSNLPYKTKKSWILEGGVHVPAAIGRFHIIKFFHKYPTTFFTIIFFKKF